MLLRCSVMTPYYSEIVTYSKKELYEENEDGISTLFYLQKIYPDEWSNFLERIECKNEEEALAKDDGKEIRLWASYKGQTLARTGARLSIICWVCSPQA